MTQMQTKRCVPLRLLAFFALFVLGDDDGGDAGDAAGEGDEDAGGSRGDETAVGVVVFFLSAILIGKT